VTIKPVNHPRARRDGKIGVDKTADSLLFTIGGAMFLVTVLAAFLIVRPSAGLMVATFCTLVVLVGAVGMFLIRFIDAEH
jgi:hypothetical protein